MKYNSFIFDFDLTLADSTNGIVKCFKKVFEKRSLPCPSDYDIKRTIGLTLVDAFNKLCGEKNPDTLEQMRVEYVSFADDLMTKNTVIFECVPALVNKLKEDGAKLGIVTTKFAYRAIEALDKSKITDFFDVVIGNEHVSEYKPSPQGLLLAMDKINAGCDETLYIGDTTVDAKTAENAGVDFAAVLTGMTEKSEFDDFDCKYIAKDLTKLFEEIKNEN